MYLLASGTINRNGPATLDVSVEPGGDTRMRSFSLPNTGSAQLPGIDIVMRKSAVSTLTVRNAPTVAAGARVGLGTEVGRVKPLQALNRIALTRLSAINS